MMMSFGGLGQLFFFDQPFQRRKKRSKIPTDSLPFQVRELRYLSGSKVKLESNFRLKNRDNEGLDTLPESPAESGGTPEEAKERKDISGQTTDYAPRKSIDLDHKNKCEKRNVSYTGVKVIGGIVQEDGDEDEDTQKFLFEETKFSAPSILSQLAKLFDRILEEKTTEEKETKKFYSEIEHSYGESIYEKHFQSERLVIILPNDLCIKLSRSYEQLIRDTAYSKRLWQSSSYRETSSTERGTTHGDSAVVSNVTSTVSTVDRKSEKMDSQTQDRERKASTQERNRRLDASNSLGSHIILQGKDSKDSGRASDFEPPTIIAYRGESKTSLTQNIRPKTRAEKFKFYHVKERSEQSKANTKLQIQRPTTTTNETEVEEATREQKQKDYVIPPIYGPTTVINFTMSSRQCVENGWVKMQNKDEDPERQTLLEWARGRLQCAIKKKEEQDDAARKRDENGPLVIQYYGDTKRDVAIKYKKGVSMARRLVQMTDESRVRFLTILPDYGGYCLYTSGRLALTRAKKGGGSPGLYTFVYSDSFPAQMLACFTPTGRACCYYKSGNLRFVCTETLVAFHEEDGTVSKKWKWSSGKLQTTAVIQINDVFTLRCVSLTNMTLHVKSHGESTKFNVGALTDTEGSEKENLSSTLKNKAEDRRTRLKKVSRQQIKSPVTCLLHFGEFFLLEGSVDKYYGEEVKHEVTDAVMEERVKELGEKFPERKGLEFDTPDCRDLYRLRYRVKNLVNDWLEHYRLTTGMTSTPRPGAIGNRKETAHSASSLPSQLPSSPRKQRKDLERAPSAPPIPKTISYRTLDSKNQQRPHSSADAYGSHSGSRKDGKRTVRIELPSSPRPNHGSNGDLDYEISPVRVTSSPSSSGPFRCGIPQQKARVAILPKEGCPIALRMELLGHSAPQCRCDKRSIPYVCDLEFDAFVRRHLPKTQLLVVLVSTSKHPRMDPCEEMLDELYYEKNKSRSFPCVQSRNDPFRLVRYDVSTACVDGNIPILQRRHNVVPGMCLMYSAGKLIFADYIFNGYGNARKDFLKQVTKSRKDGLEGVSLPSDFKFDPRPSRCGKRTPWGGEIGAPLLLTQSISNRIGNLSLSNSDLGDSMHSFQRCQKEPTSLDYVSAGLSPHSLYSSHRLSVTPRS